MYVCINKLYQLRRISIYVIHISLNINNQFFITYIAIANVFIGYNKHTWRVGHTFFAQSYNYVYT